MTQSALITPSLNPEEQAKVDAIFSGIKEHMGFVPDGLKLYSVSPPLLEAFLGNIGYFMAHPSFRQEFLATIRFLVASENECGFCIDFNEAILTNLGVDIEATRAAREDPSKAPLEYNEKLLLAQVLKNVNDPTSQSAAEIEALTNIGWSQRDIFEATLVGSNNRNFSTMLKAFNVDAQGAFA